MKFNPDNFELEIYNDNINLDRRVFLVNGGKLSIAALCVSGFIPMEAEANPLLVFRVIAGPLIKYLFKKNIKGYIKKGVTTVNTISAIDTLSGNRISTAAKDIVLSKKSETKVNSAIYDIKREIPDSIWSQSGRHSIEDKGSNKLSIIIANNSGKEINLKKAEIATIVDHKSHKKEVNLKLKQQRIKPGITVVEAKINQLPKTGLKKIICRNSKNKIIPTNQQIIVATDREVKEAERAGTASKLYEKYVLNSNYQPDRAKPCCNKEGEGVGTKIYRKYL